MNMIDIHMDKALNRSEYRAGSGRPDQPMLVKKVRF